MTFRQHFLCGLQFFDMLLICHQAGSVIRDDFDVLTILFTQKKNVCFLVTADTEKKKLFLLFVLRLFSWELLSVQVFINFST